MTKDSLISTSAWWSKQRTTYNLGLIAAGILAFIAYAVVGSFLLPPEAEFEITAFTIFFQGCGYLVMMGIANVLYYLGPISEKALRPEEPEEYRHACYLLGFWFSVLLPFTVPIALMLFN